MTSILKVDEVQDASGNLIIKEVGNTITIGESGDTTNIVGTLQNNGAALIGGITQADQWRLSANLNTNAQIITSNLERNDTSYEKIGTGMSESSGVFTFPATGVYRIDFNILWVANGDGDIRYAGGEIQYSNDDFSSSGILAESYNGCNNHGLNYYMGAHCCAFFDVDDLSNDKIKFRVTASATIDCVGSTTANYTNMTFTRLGDT